MKYIATDDVIIDGINGGIPLIKVKNESDKYYGLGFCHAVDRGMQLILTRANSPQLTINNHGKNKRTKNRCNHSEN